MLDIGRRGRLDRHAGQLEPDHAGGARYLLEQLDVFQNLRKAVLERHQVQLAIGELARRVAAVQVLGHLDDMGVATGHRIEPARHDHALRFAGHDRRAHGADVDAEADPLEPHVGDELVDVEHRQLADAVGIGRIGQVGRLEIILGLAMVDLDCLVQLAPRRVERLHARGEPQHRVGAGARQIGAAVVQRLDHQRIIDIGEIEMGLQQMVECGQEVLAEHRRIGIHAVAPADNAVLQAQRVEPAERRVEGIGNSGFIRHDSTPGRSFRHLQ